MTGIKEEVKWKYPLAFGPVNSDRGLQMTGHFLLERLMYVLHDLVERGYIGSWIAVDREVRRIARESYVDYSPERDSDLQKASKSAETILMGLEWPDPRLNEARDHYAKALRYFEHPSEPDYENAVKEAVCAVEAAALRLFPKPGAKTLGDAMKLIQGSDNGQLPKPLAATIIGPYGYRNSGEGVSHGGADGGKATEAVAEYVLALAASQVILLHEVASAAETDVPF